MGKSIRGQYLSGSLQCQNGFLLLGEGNGKFHAATPAEFGVMVEGEVRKIL